MNECCEEKTKEIKRLRKIIKDALTTLRGEASAHVRIGVAVDRLECAEKKSMFICTGGGK